MEFCSRSLAQSVINWKDDKLFVKQEEARKQARNVTRKKEGRKIQKKPISISKSKSKSKSKKAPSYFSLIHASVSSIRLKMGGAEASSSTSLTVKLGQMIKNGFNTALSAVDSVKIGTGSGGGGDSSNSLTSTSQTTINSKSKNKSKKSKSLNGGSSNVGRPQKKRRRDQVSDCPDSISIKYVNRMN